MKKFLYVLVILFIGYNSLYAISESDVLMPNQAFKPSATLKNNKINIEIKLGNEIYAYKNKLKFIIISPKNISLDKDIQLPKPVKYHGFIVYFNKVNVKIPISLIKKRLGIKKGKIKLKVHFQGCTKLGLCYAPMNKTFEFNLKNINKTVSLSTITPNQKKTKKWNLAGINSSKKKSINTKTVKNVRQTTVDSSSSISEENKIADTLSKSSLWIVLITFFGFGLLLSLTPCIFPMIPILSSIIVSQSKENMNAKRGFFLSLIYVLSMSVAYAMAGVLAGLFGSNIQIFLQNPWVITIFSAVFVALAFSMFGFYELQLPRFIQTKISKTSDSAQGKGIIGVAVMGFLSALIVGPCVAAPLAGALIYIGQTGNALLGGFALFIMSLGMGVPLLFVGIGAGKFMPKPGGWMQNVSKIFGVIMLAVALYLFSRVIPDMLTMILWAFLFIGSAVYLGALEPFKIGASGLSKIAKVTGIIFLIYGIMLFVGAYLGNTNPLNPLESSTKITTSYQSNNSNNIQQQENKFIVVKDINELEKIINSSSKPVMVDFSADWCVSCKELDVKTFGNQRVKKLLQNFTLIRADVTENSEAQKKMMKKYQVFGPPVMVFFDKNHNQLKDKKLVGFIGPDKFITHVKTILQ